MKQRLTHANFFALCEAIRNHEEKVRTLCNRREVKELVGAALDFPFTEDAVGTALKATGIPLAAKRQQKTSNQWVFYKQVLQMLCRDLVELSVKLGEPLSAEMRYVCIEHFAIAIPLPPAAKTVPVSSVTPPNNIRVANK